MLSLLPLWILFSVIKNSIATITIADTGMHYPSEPDRWYSAHFAPGYEYMAHLQAFSYDIDLCDPNANLTVTVPMDRMPVVLLASRDSCDDWTKIKIAKTKIQPPGVVEFLIIYDIVDEEVSVERKLRTPKGGIPQNPYSDFYDGVNIGVLHVSSSTGNALFSAIAQESIHTRLSGGTRLLLDGESSSRAERQAMLRKALFWSGITFLISGCCCSFILSVRLQMLDDDDNESAAAPRRPERRRLTIDQVEEWLPEYVHCCDGNEDDNSSTSTPVECTVCLDPFSDGDYLRRLPCQHKFHSYCIAKWLVERNSTCPLCKLDLLPDDEQSSEEEEEEEEASIIDTTDAPDLLRDNQEENRQTTLGLLWRRLWGRHQVDVDQTPLLSNDEQANIELEFISDDGSEADDDDNENHDEDNR
mmetsp:Transcript_12092/g.18559  ORF Transcript_12092/g.18559 Transcript_12092/m.18559 type:complete len:416 (-) Transcript_12092:164-1411(-)